MKSYQDNMTEYTAGSPHLSHYTVIRLVVALDQCKFDDES